MEANTPITLEPQDQLIRNRFIYEIDRNFSVIAPAGVGKTQAIIDRLLKMAESGAFLKRSVMVVTYTQKAAQEMEQRAFQALESQGMHGLAFLKRVFFGTIHSFAFSLIKTYGYALNISDALKILENKDALWQDFCRECVIEWPVSIESEWNELEPFLDLKAIWSLAQSSFNNECIAALPPRPSLNLDFIYAFKSPSKRLQSGVEKSIAILKDWALNWENTQKAWPFPDITAGGDDFIETVHAALKPLKDWVALSWLLMANTIKKAYMAYRLNAGYIEYGDMIAIAHQLIQLTPIKNNIEKQSYALILDEAQDVDVDQFKFMLDLVGLNGQTAVNDGRFVMVGDPQQAIYSQRTPVEVYLNTHQRLIHEGWVEPLIFSVTFRCGKNIIHYLNERGPVLLNSKNGPVDFVPLVEKPFAHAGEVCQLYVPHAASVEDFIAHEARFIAQFLKNQSPASLGVDVLSEMVILCPRNDWLMTLSEALSLAAVPYQLYNKQLLWRELPAFTFLLALLKVIEEPYNALEINGLLRNLWGIADADIFEWVQSQGPIEYRHPLSLLQTDFKNDEISQILKTLKDLRALSFEWPLRSFMRALIEKTQLIERLNQLPIISPINHADCIQSLLFEVSEKMPQGTTLRHWVDHWSQRLFQPFVNPVIEKDKIQLMSCHSAKGLEWDLVLLPYLSRPIQDKLMPYPQVLKDNQTESVFLKLDKTHDYERLQVRLAFEKQSENRRLLYVSLTRARKKLILVNYSEGLVQSTSNSFYDYLKIDNFDANNLTFKNLPILNN